MFFAFLFSLPIQGTAPFLITPAQGLGEHGTVTQVQGCDVSCSDTSKFKDATDAAAAADAVVLVVGLDQHQERYSISLELSM